MKKLIVETKYGKIEGLHGGYPSEIEFDWEHMAKKGMVVCRGFESDGLQIIHILGHRYRTD